MNDPLLLRLRTAILGFIFYCVLFGGTAFAEPRGLNLLREIQSALISLADRVRPAVVSISPYVPPSQIVQPKGLGRGRPSNAGAGVIIDGEKGLIVTNSHVVRSSDKVQVTLFGGKEKIGEVLGTDEDTDLALVRIELDEPMPSVKFADSQEAKVGQMVVAVGNPYGLNDTMTFGIISGLNRENINLSRYEDFIQTDASINPGNSGGPLITLDGEVIGINTAIINYAQSIGFAIPSNMVQRVVSQLREFGEVRRGWLGVGIEPVNPELVDGWELLKEGEGVMVNSVFDGDPAHKAGVKVGDVILKIGGVPVNSPARMIRIIGVISPGQTVHLDILRDGQSQLIPVKLEQQKNEVQARASLKDQGESTNVLGIEVLDAAEELDSDEDKEGLGISRIAPGSSAEAKGLQTGDRILSVNGEIVTSRKHYENIVHKIPRGGPVFLLLKRDEKKFHLALVQEN